MYKLRRTQPHWPVQIGWHRLLGQIVRRGRSTYIGIDPFHFSDLALLHHLHSMLEVDIGTLLTAHGEDHSIVAYSLHQHLSLFDGKGEGFFQIDVFLCSSCISGHKCMPVVGAGDYHRIDVFAGNQLLVIFIYLHHRRLFLRCIMFIHTLEKTFPLHAIHIAPGHDLHALHTEVTVQQIHGLPAKADKTETNNLFTASCCLVLFTRGKELRKDGHTNRTHGGRFDKFPS